MASSDPGASLGAMDETVLERARARIVEAVERGGSPESTAALARARAAVEALVEATAAIPVAVQEGVRAEAAPVGRQLAEVRGLANQMVRRLERIEGDLLAERNARIEDLAVLVELIASGWKNVDERLERIEHMLGSSAGAAVYSLEQRRTAS